MELFDPVILWTDALIYLLLILSVVAAILLRKNRQFMGQWYRVFHSKAGSISSVVLVFYVSIGLLDTLHFHPVQESQEGQSIEFSTEVISVLDWMMEDIKNNTEKTYSAPFASHLFVKENIEVQGIATRDYPKLKYAGQHLYDQKDKPIDVVLKVVEGSMWGFLAAFILLWIMVRVFVTEHAKEFLTDLFIKDKHFAIQWRALIITFFALLMLATTLVHLSGYYHILGTDKVGQDVFYQAVKSIRTGLVIGTLTTLIMLPFAILLGIMAGYFKGWVDDVIQYLYTTLNSVPGILLIAASVLMLQVYMSNNADAFATVEQRSDARLFFLCLILGITSWTGLCRMLRGESLKLRELDYIQASRILGSSHLKVITQHILPNVMHLVLISIVLDFSGLVLAEAVLAYVEIGVDPSMNSWGNMINSARLEMSREPIVWWSLFAAFCFMFVLVLAANLFSDAVRDAFDPRTRGRV